MKIAIVTLVDNINNGNRLQNYAMQETLKKVYPDAEVNTIKLKHYKGIYQTCKFIAKNIIKKVLGIKQTQIKNFKKFNKNITFTSKTYHEMDNLTNLAKEYDFFITGSDQVWNMGYYDNERYYFLDWVPTNKKLSYAASIGNNNLTNKRKAIFKNLLKSYNYISVREKQSEVLLKELGINNVETHIDPTLVLTQSEWANLAKKPKYDFKKEYIFVCLLGKTTNEYNQKINEVAEKYNLEIINLRDQKNKNIFCSGPSEFIWLIKNAKLVITDSFHSIVFSIINKTPFIHFSRQQISDDDASANINSRIENLERLFGVSFTNEHSLDAKHEDLFKVKITNPDEVLNHERERTFNYLKQALSSKLEQTPTCLNCTGCGLCANMCPQKAISIVKNENGFYQFNVDNEKCTNCGLCRKLCPANHSYEKYDFSKSETYGVKNKVAVTDNSSSAGIFGKLATHTINNGGVVYGLKYSNHNEFSRIDNLEQLDALKGSKYYQANISTAYPLIEQDLKDNKQVLVCSTPCQTAGLKQKFEKYNNLTLVSIICHGATSKDVLDKYCLDAFDEIPSNINFRKKSPYWHNYNIEFSFENSTKEMPAFENLWFKNYIANTYLNQCCYNCNFAGKEFGADIILGDFWGIKKIDNKFFDPYGTSICICQTEHGKNLFNEISNQFITKQYTCFNKIKQHNPCLFYTNYNPLNQYKQELFFLNHNNGLSFAENINNINENFKQTKTPFIKRVIRKVKKLIKRALNK